MPKQDCQNNVEPCKNVFVTWAWLVGVIIGFIVIIGSVSFVVGKGYNHIDNITAENGQQIQQTIKRVENLESIHSDIDTVKILIRQQNEAIKKQKRGGK
jgi:hypothetical protein